MFRRGAHLFPLLGAIMLSLAVPAAGASAAEERVFGSPEEAAAALDEAWQSDSQAELLAIFGRAGEKLVSSGDPIADHDARERLAAAYAEQHRIETDGDRKATLILGKDDWPYPIPLVRPGFGWQFDAAAGAQEIIDRRIGGNEMNAIAVCRAYVDAQRDYAAGNPRGDGVREFARKVTSSNGKRDGLYWPAPRGAAESPLGPLLAAAEAHGFGWFRSAGRSPFHGYFYRVLTRQGKHAPGGARDYVVHGHMTGGFALIAYPAKYGDSGIMTFMVNQDGIVFEKNLGPETAVLTHDVAAYDPDPSWQIVGNSFR